MFHFLFFISVKEPVFIVWVFGFAKANDDTMDMSLFVCLTIPTKGAIGKVDMCAELADERFPKIGYLFALCDAVGGY